MGVPVGKLCCLVCCRNRRGRIGDNSALVLPHNPDDLKRLGREWMTKAFHYSAVLDKERDVLTMELRPMRGAGVGLLGVMCMVEEITYSGEATSLRPPPPDKLVAKFASPDFGTRLITDLFGLTRAEINFYLWVQPAVTPTLFHTPRAYFADINNTTGSLTLLLEFLDKAEFVDQLDGELSPADGLLVAESLAKLHARWWRHKALEDPRVAKFVPGTDDPLYKIFPKEVRKAYKRLKKRDVPYADQMTIDIPQSFDAVAESIFDELFPLMQRMSTPDWPVRAVCHGDPRLDNAYFVGTGAERQVGWLDWQTLIMAGAPADVSWFLMGMPTKWQTDNEQMVISRYLEVLRERVELSPEDWADGWALGIVQNTCKSLVAFANIKTSPEGKRAFRLVDHMLGSQFRMWERYNVREQWQRYAASVQPAKGSKKDTRVHPA
eukprot:TRINITY_DN60757_c0_g1_i1.p1 TRINITY_DN60757_c0_g1~~TRINITY_DN60757_c0_g1_i1.p1  ORF type:complete len:436 (+),score=132.69 TRINITY_DN60757_c0_g1_i1:302-1609(+)